MTVKSVLQKRSDYENLILDISHFWNFVYSNNNPNIKSYDIFLLL